MDRMNTSSMAPSLQDGVDRLAACVVGIVAHPNHGSGVLWRDGVVVGSASVLRRASSVGLVRPDGEQVQGELRGFDCGTDLAAVAIPSVTSVTSGTSGAMTVAERAGDAPVRIGDFVFTVGRSAAGLTQASFGHIGAVAGEWRTWRGGQVDRLIRLDGGLYPGFAGAPVADAAGRVIGIASHALSRHHAVVLPASTVDRVLDELLAHGRVPQGYLGIAAQPVRATLDGAAVDGLLVSSLADDGPAAQAGVRVSDVIVEIGGHVASSLEVLRGILKVGARLPVLLSRGGARVEVVLEVGQRPASRCG
jgi:serine protease Do